MAIKISRTQIEEKEKEAEHLRQQLEQVRQEARTCESHIKATGLKKNTSVLPTSIQSASATVDKVPPELRAFLQWIVGNVDLSRSQVFQCNAEGEPLHMNVAGKDLVLQQMIAWPLPQIEGIKMSVPLSLQARIFTLISEAQRRGLFLEKDIIELNTDWELIVADFAVTEGVVEPWKILVHRKSSDAMICARWPVDILAVPSAPQCDQVSEYQAPVSAPFDFIDKLLGSTVQVEKMLPESEYQGFVSHPSHGEKPIDLNLNIVLGRWTALGSNVEVTVSIEDDTVTVSDAQTKLVGTSDDAGIVRGEVFQDGIGGGTFELSPVPQGTWASLIGPRQCEVKFGEEWFTGVLLSIQSGIAYVHCEVDKPEVTTRVPVDYVRVIQYVDEDQLEQQGDSVAEEH